MVVFDFITRQMRLYYFLSKSFTGLICIIPPDISWCKQKLPLNRNIRQRVSWVATRIRSHCLGYWPPKLTKSKQRYGRLNEQLITSFDIIIIHFIWWIYNERIVFVCLFVWVYRPTQICHLWRNHHYRWSAVNFHLCSTFMGIEQWGFSNAPHLPTLYKCHLRGLVTVTPVAELLVLELSLPVFTTQVCRYRGSNPDIQHANSEYSTATLCTCTPPRRLRTGTILHRPIQMVLASYCLYVAPRFMI